ncbi:hypothetical protein OPT61_g4168 [Boeremia exigua]|uniref:Uncharacterized protein n=1 Tax=Boeremia exigua TaxID=749465 RepID=A0ACC2IF78_9PLEO|nr:hypothetical protein OPT61_g4168 [Boeremia exigua]
MYSSTTTSTIPTPRLQHGVQAQKLSLRHSLRSPVQVLGAYKNNAHNIERDGIVEEIAAAPQYFPRAP